MYKRILAVLLVIALIFINSFIFAQEINTEEIIKAYTPLTINDEKSVKEFANLYMEGKSFERLYSMFEEVLVMHVPIAYFSDQLKAVEHLTGKFVSFGNYETFENSETRTHVLYLNMEHKTEVMILTMGAPYRTKGKGKDFSRIYGLLFVMLDKNGTTKIEEPKENKVEFVEKEINIGNDPWKINAAVILPNNTDKKVPSVVLVQGAGFLNKDGTVQAVSPMKDIAEGLAKFGIASIRFDKRTLSHKDICTDEYYKSFTVKEELIDDTILATEALKEFEQIDEKNIYIIGHDIGATLVPRIVSENKDIFAGCVMLSSTPLSMIETIRMKQLSQITSLSGEDLSKALSAMLTDIEKSEKIASFSKEEVIKQMIFGKNMYYYYEQLAYDNTELVKNIELPILIIQGSKDFEISNEIGFKNWKALLENKKNAKMLKYSSLNHMLMEYKGDLKYERTIDEYSFPNNVSEQVITDIAAWISSKGE